ncbi:MAG: tetratricopeptide repeat protein [Chitinophagales bacterium]
MKKLFFIIAAIVLLSAQLQAQTAEAYYSQGYSYSAKGDKQAAVDSYTKAIQINGNYKKAYAERGILYSSMGEKDKALDDFSKALNIDPSYDYARRNRAAIYMEREKFEAAVKDYDQLIQQDPQFSFYYDLRGVANYKINRKEAALADFTKALEISPDNEEVQVKRAKLLLELGKDEEAYEMLAKTNYSKEKLSNEAKLQLGRSSRKTGEYERAVSYLEDLAKNNFKPEYVNLELGLCYLHLKQFEKAIRALDNCLAHNPNNEIAFINKASAESQSGNYAKAADTYTTILDKFDNNHYRALNGRAIAYYAMGEAEMACSDWEKAAESGDQNAKDNLEEYCSEEALQAVKQQAVTNEKDTIAPEQVEEIEQEEIEDLPEEDVQETEMEEAEDEQPKKEKKKKSKKEKLDD